MIGLIMSQFCILENLGKGGLGVDFETDDARLKHTLALGSLDFGLIRNVQGLQPIVVSITSTSAP